ncbi:MAG: HutD family protein [Bdellovibrionota bacterium]
MNRNARLLKPNDMKAMPWKNGGGTTLQVAISPSRAEVGLLDFDWRVSIANVDADGPFSAFPGYDRQLVVWSGPGILINGSRHEALDPFEFSGDTPIEAKLLAEPIAESVKDFGVIYKRGKFTSEMTIHKLQAEKSALIDFKGGECFILCARGELRIDGLYLNPGDVFHTSEAGSFQVKALERADCALIALSNL